MTPPNMHLKPFSHTFLHMSTAERALIDIAQDRRYWIIHSITIPSLFVGGVIFMLSGFVYKLFGALNFNKYFDSSISLIKDRFSDFLDYTLRSHAYEPHVAGHASKKKSCTRSVTTEAKRGHEKPEA